jgi:SAM-dependent methyltransferase
MALYGQDLAYIQAVGFGGFARGAAPELVRRLRAASIAVSSVVEVGCGAGPLSAELVKSGFEVTGVDVSAALLEIARAKVPGARFVSGSIYRQEISRCQAIVAVGEPLTYHTGANGDERVREFLRRAGEVLPEGGVLIFDVIELGEPSLQGRSWKAGEDWAVLVDTREDQGSRVLEREIATFRRVGELYRRGREMHRVRLFDGDEMRGWLSSAGFVVETSQGYGAYALPPRRRAFFCWKGA